MTQALTLDRTSWNVGNERSYDVWGGVRSGNATGGPKGRYCANLGHVQDDESGLIYMRARYYEPSSGRFISEDPAKDGTNWYRYAENTPTAFSDPDGLSALKVIGTAMLMGAVLNLALQWAIFGNVRAHLVFNAAFWAALGAGLGRFLAMAMRPVGKAAEAGEGAFAAFTKGTADDRLGYTVGSVKSQMWSEASSRTLEFGSEERGRNGPLGKALDRLFDNAVGTRILIELMGLDD